MVITRLVSYVPTLTRLIARISTIAAAGDYIVVGHSLGSILLRAALSSSPEGTIRPRHIFLLGSPIHSSHLANKLKKNLIFRAFTGDCGQLLSSTEQMNAIGSCSEPTTCIVGVGGPKKHFGFFGTEANDGLVSVSEASATWLPTPIEVPLLHIFLPLSKRVAAIIIEKVAGQ